ncbi:MAG: thioredoxin domain-containing protein [Pyrinomonadaceae bacterium]
MNKTNNVPEKKSNTPILIIGVVLVAALLAGWYLLSSPKTASNTNTANKTNTANTTKPTTIPANAPQGANPPNQLGSPTALVTLEEFADFQCPQCGAVNPIMNEIKSTYGSRIRFIFRNYPLAIPAHDKSYNAAVACEAAGMQSPNKFWELQNLLFTNQKAWTADPNYRNTWKEYAQRIGLDVAKWENDMAGIAAKSRVDEDMRRGKALGVNSTPTLYLNGVDVPFQQMNVTSLKQLIDAELAKTAPQKQTAPAAPANTGNTNK